MKRIFILILSLILIFSMVACTRDNIDSDKDTRLPTEGKEEIENGIDDENPDEEEETNTDQDKSEEVSDKWPEDFMPEAPKLEGDIVISKEEGPKKYFLKFDNIEYDEAVSYVNTVKEAGFSKNANDHIDRDAINYKGMDEDNNLLIFHWNKNGISKLELIKKKN